MMPLITTCCACWELRQGTFVSCAYSLIYALVAVGLSAYGIHSYLNYGFRTLSNDTALSTGLGMEQRVLYVANCVDIGLYAVLILSVILVILGVKKLQRFLFIPYLVTMGMLVVLQFLVCLLSVITMFMSHGPQEFVELFLAVVFFVVDLMCWVCVFSYYQEMRDGRAQIRANYTIRVPEISQSEKTEVTIDTSRSFDGPPAYTALYPKPSD
ncbi:uncharacterized protein LOC119728883 isoform X2 [Patiria miniata]|uniref:Uncharacterized protein n=1 Tax=Patiria miniata TaxID=46514 RepID=A0A914A1L4_PATMI|nr:uncharacterized protein LOC119728883 isoform X2 [Patiria miniata]